MRTNPTVVTRRFVLPLVLCTWLLRFSAFADVTTMNTATNIVASIGEEFGSGGQRNLGFTEAQSALILYHATRTYQRLGLAN